MTRANGSATIDRAQARLADQLRRQYPEAHEMYEEAWDEVERRFEAWDGCDVKELARE